jgi:hypothetical protein
MREWFCGPGRRLKEIIGGFEADTGLVMPREHVALGVPELLALLYRETSGMPRYPFRWAGLSTQGRGMTHVCIPAITSLGLQSLGPLTINTGAGYRPGEKLRARITFLGESWDLDVAGTDAERFSQEGHVLLIGRDVLARISIPVAEAPDGGC